MKSSIIVVASFVVISGFPVHVSADSNASAIAITGDATPNSHSSLSLFSFFPELNDSAQVAFSNRLTGTSGGTLTKIIRKSQLATDEVTIAALD